MNNQILLILGMMLVTYIPRLLPFIMASEKKLPVKLNKFLQFIPYTALGALIIPEVFSAIPEMPLASLLGIGFSFVYGWYKGGIIIPVLGSILVSFLTLLMYNSFVF
ncbi:AzlD domain-containing protein [Abyssisolibacter fermentans]|uniref:AzlD domain-containing protein n=1 Tax=Abyssisolibacter fermentans TaxID=1766203 RepID=UPI00082FB9AC|nr:AzlD domain-containing protein [Abyssisolibacter fermentans]